MIDYTKIRVLSANFRYENPADDAAGRGWVDRRDKAIDLVRAWAPSVIMAQECSEQIRADLLAGLGGGTAWGYWRNGNVSVWASKAHHDRIVYDNTVMLPVRDLPDGSPGDPRRLVWVKLRNRLTGNDWYAAASHFSAGDPVYQMLQMPALLDALPDVRNTILGADVNSSGMVGASPRDLAREGGLVDLRSKFAEYSIRDGALNSYNGFGPSVAGGEWIDDVFTGGNYQPYYGRVVRTDLGGGPNASDHNWVLASSIQLNEETVV